MPFYFLGEKKAKLGKASIQRNLKAWSHMKRSILHNVAFTQEQLSMAEEPKEMKRMNTNMSREWLMKLS